MLVALLGAFALPAQAADYTAAAASLEENLQNIVYIECGNVYGEEFVTEATGSGVVLSDGIVLTNAHVVSYDIGDDYWYFYDWCVGGYSEYSYLEPDIDIIFEVDWDFFTRTYDGFDYAILNAYDLNWDEYVFPSYAGYGNPDSLIHGDEITLIGYPSLGGGTITSTSGAVSGFESTDWIKTDAIAEFGNSGGGAFDANGNLIGIPTIVATGQMNSITYIQNLNAILEDMFGMQVVVRDYPTLYTTDNVTCVADDCYQYGEGVDDLDVYDNVEAGTPTIEDVPIKTTSQGPSDEALSSKYDPAMLDNAMINRMSGKILLQVEQHGEAWYLHPELEKRYYMKDGPTAYEMMRSFGLGITDIDLEKIPMVETPDEMLDSSSVCSYNSLARQVKGRILLQVEQHGEAWYIHPDTCRRIYMKDGAAAYSIMRYLSAGILDIDLKKIPSDVLVPVE